MLRYIPQFILRQAASGASQGSLDAFALLFDIADFTRIGTSLQALGKQGAEDLSAMLDDLFAEPIQFIESYGGFVSLFAGDAFCAIFPNAESTAVASAVNAIRGWLAAHNSYPTSAGTFELKVRLTVTRGELRWRIFANPFQHEYAFFGEPMRELAALSELKLDHIFSEQAANAIGLDRFHRVEGGWSLADIDFSPPPAPGDIPPAVAARERFQNPRFAASTPQPEIRSAAFCFASLEGIEPSARETAIADLEQLADACHGLVNKLDATDKGLLAIILFGLPLTEGRTLHQICKFSLAALARQPLLALGISCGEVIAGYTGAGQAREYTAMGHPVNLAARLMGKARPGEILTDAGFWQEFHQSYSFTYLGLLNLKGIDQPLRYYSLSHQTPATVARQENAFTGREAELASLRQMLAAAPDSGSNPVIYVCGEPGIGKSRLVREALAPWLAAGWHVFQITCDPLVREPLEAFRQIAHAAFYYNPLLPQAAGLAMFNALWSELAQGDAELLRVESVLASLLGYESEGSVWSMLPPEEKPAQLANALLAFIARLAAGQTVLIHVDDAQWLDPESLAVLRELSASGTMPLPLICSCRPLEDGADLDLLLPGHQACHLQLGNLDASGCAALIGSILRLDAVPASTLELIAARSMGNPLFVEQLTAYLQENGSLNAKGAITAELGYLSSFGISDIVGGRIDRLADDVRECVTSASVLGAEFNIQVLSRMLDLDLQPELETGVRNRIWRSVDELSYIFSHILIRDTIYQRTLGSRLRDLHRLAAESLQIIHAGDPGPFAAEIARHFGLAGLGGQAAQYWFQAGNHYDETCLLPRAEECFRKALELSQQVLGPDHPDTATVLNNLGNLCHRSGRFEEAEPLLSAALDIRVRVLGAEHPDTADTLVNLASLHDSQGRYEQVEDLFLRALAVKERVCGPEHPDTISILNNLGLFHYAVGKYELAEQTLRRALDLRIQQLGPEHPETALLMHNLALTLQCLGKFDQVEELLNRAVAICETALGPDHPETATLRSGLANWLKNQGDLSRAEQLHLRVLDTRERVLGKEHNTVADTLLNLGNLYGERGELERAEQVYTRALAIYEQAFGPEHPDVALLLSNLASVHIYRGEPALAEPYYLRALAIRRKLLGDEHPDTAALMNHLARCYQQQEKFGQAEPLLRQALAVASRSLGPEHPGTADIIESLASLNNSLGRLDEASELYRQAIAIHSASEGPEHPHTAIAIYNLFDTCFNGGRLREAEPLCRKALEIWSKTLGSDHPWTIEALKTLVAIYTKLPEPDKAAHYQALLPPEPEA